MSQIVLKQLVRPKEYSLNDDLTWFCGSFGLSSGRDICLTSHKIISDILEQASEEKAVFSDTLAHDLHLSQNLINHHLRNLISSGLVTREKKHILIRGGTLREAVVEIRKDALRILDAIEGIAKEIDKELGLKNRD